MKKACIINIWFGNLPENFYIWKKTAQFNKNYDFYVFTDDVTEKQIEGNVHIIPMTLDELKERVHQKIGQPYTHLTQHNIHKLCDLKVAFGHIFEDVADNYDWWAWTDLDVYYGNFENFIPDNVWKEYDFIGYKTSSAGFTCDIVGKIKNKKAPVIARIFGPFLLVKKEHKYFYQNIPDYQKRIVNSEYGVDNSNKKRFGVSAIDEFEFAECIEKYQLKMYTHFKKDRFEVNLIRTGDPRWPKVWKNGCLTIPIQPNCSQDFKEKIGFETLLLHIGYGKEIIDYNKETDTITFDNTYHV